jgi:hypothetical protein
MHDGPFFTGTLLKLHNMRSEGADFNVLQAQIDGRNVTTLRGDRLLTHLGRAEVQGALMVGSTEATEKTALGLDSLETYATSNVSVSLPFLSLSLSHCAYVRP